MPTSISHIGGRARVNEPGRYRKKNNKNLMAQGVPTFIGMPQPLRNLIAKRVKSSQAVTKKKGPPQCTNCNNAVAGAAVTLAVGTSISGTVRATCKNFPNLAGFPPLNERDLGIGINNGNAGIDGIINGNPGIPLAVKCCGLYLGENISGCPPSGMYFQVTYDPDPEFDGKIELALLGVDQNNYAPGSKPTQYSISVTRAGVDLGSGEGNPRIITATGEALITSDDLPTGDLQNYQPLEAAATGDPPSTGGGTFASLWSFESGIANTILDGDTIKITFS